MTVIADKKVPHNTKAQPMNSKILHTMIDESRGEKPMNFRQHRGLKRLAHRLTRNAITPMTLIMHVLTHTTSSNFEKNTLKLFVAFCKFAHVSVCFVEGKYNFVNFQITLEFIPWLCLKYHYILLFAGIKQSNILPLDLSTLTF